MTRMTLQTSTWHVASCGPGSRVGDPLASGGDLTEFRLQFGLTEVSAVAARYSYEADDHVLEIGRRARERGWYSRDELVDVCEWKTVRSRSRVARNSEALVEEATRIALAATTEEVRIEVLMILSGVSWPTASVLLHLAHHDRYPILDYRALEALGIDRPPAYSMPFWLDYVSATRDLAHVADVDMRTLDRALWQWSKEREDPKRGRPHRARRNPSSQPAAAASRQHDSVHADVVVLGCVKTKQRGPSKARDLYTSSLFRKRRTYAVASGRPWVIFSAKHGILDPDDVIETYDVALAKLPAAERREKGAQAAQQLERKFGSLHGMTFEIHAGDAYVSSLRQPLEARGAILIYPLEGLSFGQQLQWYGR